MTTVRLVLSAAGGACIGHGLASESENGIRFMALGIAMWVMRGWDVA